MEIKTISNNLFQATEHLVEAGKFLQCVEFEETQQLAKELYFISKSIVEILQDLEPRIKEQNKINELYKEDINNLESIFNEN